MKAYWIFVICLTAAYIIYYAVNIARDLYGRKDANQSGEETFEVDLSDDDTDAAGVAVAESETGFSVGDETYETALETDATDAGRDSEDAEGKAEAIVKALKAKVEAEMEDIEPCFSDPFSQEELKRAMVSKGCSGARPALVWKSSIDRL